MVILVSSTTNFKLPKERKPENFLPVMVEIFLIDFRLRRCIFLAIIIIIIINPDPANSLTFNLTNIGPRNQNREIITEGDGAYISDQGIQVTPDGIGSDRTQRAGRATYVTPLHLWDNASGQLADFTTSFTFVIDSNQAAAYGDGLAFFLAQNNSMITRGGAFGLPIDPSTIVATARFVAVEFDTFWNDWDPRDRTTNSSVGDHVGIDVSSLTSVRAERWLSNITYGRVNEVWISYDSVSKNLSVLFTGYQNNARVVQSGLSYAIDLRSELPERVIFGFSASTGGLFQKNNVISWSFNSTDLQIDENNLLPVTPPVASPSPPVPKEGGGSKTGRVVGLSIGACVVLGVFALVGFGLWKKMRGGNEDEDEFGEEMNNEFEMGTGPKRFSYDELAHATSNFAEEQKLGEGGFGGVYKGFLKELSSYVAVKRVSKSSRQGIKEYAAEVKIISRLRHRNLVQLFGWCHEKKELLLVYDFMENGSLDAHLFKKKSLLTWGVRYKICQGLASALLYLHEEWEQCILHRDIKASNIMLDSNFTAKLGDFGLAKLVDHEKGSQTTVLAGTMGYMAPECCITGKATKESDVFSFGVVALEIACGRKSIEFKAQENQMRLVEWVWELYGTGNLLEAADPKLGADFDEREMECLMVVGLWCAHPDENRRPSIRQAIHALNFDAALPILPSMMPVATYSAPPTSLAALPPFDINVPQKSETRSSSSYGSNTVSSTFSTSSGALLHPCHFCIIHCS